MKQIRTIILLCTVLTLSLTPSSCKKKESDSPSIIGKWSVKSYVITNFENKGVDVDDTKGDSPRPTFEFKSDGTFIETLEKIPQNTTYTLSGNKVTFGEAIAFDHTIFTYTISGSTLILKTTLSYKTPNNVSYTENTTVTLNRL